jgi:ribonuclease HII
VPSFRFELRCEGRVAGIDEAGRGPLAGPVFAAAAIIDRTRAARKLLRRINDSKMLTFEEREEAYEAMIASGVVLFAIAEASVEEIDSVNILQATFLAMRRALRALPMAPVAALVDGNCDPRLPCPAHPVIGGDGLSLSIAAASVVAKVARDRLMQRLAERYDGYGWTTNVGYGTVEHRAAIVRLGLTPHHRLSFQPSRDLFGYDANESP